LSCSFALDKRLSITDLFYNTSGIYFECRETEAILKIDTIMLKDLNGNHYHFMDSKLLHGQTLDQLDEKMKNDHLIAFNGVLLDNHIAGQSFATIDHLIGVLLHDACE